MDFLTTRVRTARGLRDRRFAILDRDANFAAQFRRMLDEAGIEVVQTAVRVPKTNAIAERFVWSAKRECLEQWILFGAHRLQRALKELVVHHHTERPSGTRQQAAHRERRRTAAGRRRG